MTSEAIYLHQNNKWLRSHSEAKAEIPHDVAIRRIEANGGHYDPNIEGFDAWDQMLTSEGIHTSSFTNYSYQTDHANENGSVMGMCNDACKLHVNFELTQSKQQAISKLKCCTSKTPPPEIAACLEELFKEWPSKAGHWLYMSQRWNPREINKTVVQLIKLHERGQITLQNPPAYFTFLMRYREPRKMWKRDNKRVDKVL